MTWARGLAANDARSNLMSVILDRECLQITKWQIGHGHPHLGCGDRRGHPVVVPVRDQLGGDNPCGEAHRSFGAGRDQVVAQLRYPGLGHSRRRVVAHAHEFVALLQRDPVVRVGVAPAADVMQPERMAELVQDRGLQKADAVPDIPDAGLPGVPIKGEVAVGEEAKSPLGQGEGAEARLPRLDDEEALARWTCCR